MTRWRAVFTDPANRSSGAGGFIFDLPDDVDPLDETFRRAPAGFEFVSVHPLREYDGAFAENAYPKPMWNVDQGDERDRG